jgi:hypothetical protein
MPEELSQVGFIQRLQKITGTEIKEARFAQFIKGLGGNKIGSASANTIVLSLPPHAKFVLKITPFTNEEKVKFFDHSQRVQTALLEKLRAVAKPTRQNDTGMLFKFLNIQNSKTYYCKFPALSNGSRSMFAYPCGMVIERQMVGLDVNAYFSQLAESNMPNKEEVIVGMMIKLIMVMSKVVFKLYKLGVNHNDLHAGNVFLLHNKPINTWLYSKREVAALPFTPVVFDFDWASVKMSKGQMLYQENYDRMITPPCYEPDTQCFENMCRVAMLKPSDAGVPDPKRDCHFPGLHTRYTFRDYGKNPKQMSAKVDIADFFMSLVTLLGKIKPKIPDSPTHTALNFLYAIYNIYVEHDFDITKCYKAVRKVYHAYLTLVPVIPRINSATRSAPSRAPPADVQEVMSVTDDMEVDKQGGRRRGKTAASK